MIVVDSSAIVDALGSAPGTDDLRTQLVSHDLHAPMLLDYEVVSALRAMCRSSKLSVARASDLLADFDDLPIRRWEPAGPLRTRAFQLRASLSAYDAAYVALAEALDCPLLTRDIRLARSHGHSAQIAFT